ncbi:MAG: NAD(+) diphosphatase [Prevotella sp.]|nr:NAD(+) diphosphatase [Candidatus Prevotella equi]
MLDLNIEAFEGSCLAFANRDIILREDNSLLSYDDLMTIREHTECYDVFSEPEYGICAMGLKHSVADVSTDLPDGFKTMTLRLYLDDKSEEEKLRVSRAKALTEWLSKTRYCCRCGKPLKAHKSLTALCCDGCGEQIFPRIEPCIIVLVRRGNKILLARHVQRNQNIYACIAGFMEAGETVEQCVRREIKEETGITVKNVRYFDSQSWPYPSQLMLGFTAEYESGELSLQEDEISDAGWYDIDDCPATPPPGSIAYRLIETTKDKIRNM